MVDGGGGGVLFGVINSVLKLIVNLIRTTEFYTSNGCVNCFKKILCLCFRMFPFLSNWQVSLVKF